jgi:tetratricopeptide (TPR) repeat protein
MFRVVSGLVLGVMMTTGAIAASGSGNGAAKSPVAAGGTAKEGAPVIFDEAYFLQAAQSAVQSGDDQGAVELWQSAIIYAPADPLPYQRIAQFYAEKRQPELAQRYYSLALQVQPTYAPALQGLAMLDLAAGDRKGAMAQREVLIHACATCPETAQVEKALSEQGPVLDRGTTSQ